MCPSKAEHIKESDMAVVPDVPGVNINSREAGNNNMCVFAAGIRAHNCPGGRPDMPEHAKEKAGGRPYEGEPRVRFGR